jgi:hypothetical protein
VGVVTLNSVNQSSWNIDKCDGTGTSGFNLDITKAQIFFTDFEWLGVGKVRCGFITDKAEIIIAHEFRHANSVTFPYMRTPNLPIRCEIRNTGIPTGSRQMRQICSTVMSEGGDPNVGQLFSNLLKSASGNIANGISYPILALRLKSTFQSYENRMYAILNQYNIYSQNDAYYRIIKLPNTTYLNLGTSTWVSDSSNSGIECAKRSGVGDMSYNTQPDQFCFVYDSGYIASGAGGTKGNTLNINPEPAKENYIVRNFSNSDSEVYVVELTGINTGGTNNAFVSIQWREIY